MCSLPVLLLCVFVPHVWKQRCSSNEAFAFSSPFRGKDLPQEITTAVTSEPASRSVSSLQYGACWALDMCACGRPSSQTQRLKALRTQPCQLPHKLFPKLHANHKHSSFLFSFEFWISHGDSRVISYSWGRISIRLEIKISTPCV